MLEKKGLSDTRIAQITGISLRTITQWKTQKDTYRYKLYRLLKTMDESELIKAFSQNSLFLFLPFFCLAIRFLLVFFCLFLAYPVFQPCAKFYHTQIRFYFYPHTRTPHLKPPARIFTPHFYPPREPRHILARSVFSVFCAFCRFDFLAL